MYLRTQYSINSTPKNSPPFLLSLTTSNTISRTGGSNTETQTTSPSEDSNTSCLSPIPFWLKIIIMIRRKFLELIWQN